MECDASHTNFLFHWPDPSPCSAKCRIMQLMKPPHCTKNPELCSMHCGDQFGLEFNWNGALNPVVWFCRGIGAAVLLSVSFFQFEQESLQDRVSRPLLFLPRGNSKLSDKSFQRLRIALKSKTTMAKTKRLWSQLFLLQKLPKCTG